jgi:hypothetical protein
MQSWGVARQIDARLVWFCGALLGIDLLFILVHSAHAVYILSDNDNTPTLGRRWNIERDASYAEIFGYGKTLIVLYMLVSIRTKYRPPIYLALIAIYTFVLLDDALHLHEVLGRGVAYALDLQPFAGLRARDVGELIVWTIFGVPLLALTLAAFVRSPPADRANGLLLLAALALLALFAVVADMAHVLMMDAFRGADLLFIVIEDGGEQIALTLTCAVAILIRRELQNPAPPHAAGKGAPCRHPW